jgi:hypothetical protein
MHQQLSQQKVYPDGRTLVCDSLSSSIRSIDPLTGHVTTIVGLAGAGSVVLIYGQPFSAFALRNVCDVIQAL